VVLAILVVVVLSVGRHGCGRAQFVAHHLQLLLLLIVGGSGKIGR
jgi:hypothetical protein